MVNVWFMCAGEKKMIGTAKMEAHCNIPILANHAKVVAAMMRLATLKRLLIQAHPNSSWPLLSRTKSVEEKPDGIT